MSSTNFPRATAANAVQHMVDTAISDRPDVAFQRAVEATRQRRGCGYAEAARLTAAANPQLASHYRAFTQALRILNLPPLNRGEG